MARKVNPKSLANLKPIKKGEVRNPQGINRKRPITDRYYERSESPLPESIRKRVNKSIGEEILQPGATWAEANALRRFLSAIDPDGQPSSKEIREAIEGKAPQRLEISGPERKEITIAIRFVKSKPR
jgi:hypothetical protein